MLFMQDLSAGLLEQRLQDLSVAQLAQIFTILTPLMSDVRLTLWRESQKLCLRLLIIINDSLCDFVWWEKFENGSR